MKAEHPIGMVLAHRGNGLHGIGAGFDDVFNALVDDSRSPDGHVAVEHDHEVCLVGAARFVFAYRVPECIVQTGGIVGEWSGALDTDHAPFLGQTDCLRTVCGQGNSVDTPGLNRVVEGVLDDGSTSQTPYTLVRQPLAACPSQNDRQGEHVAWIGERPART